MAYPFPEIENYTVYPRTFLKDVCVSLYFRPVLPVDEAIDRFVDFRQKNFHIPVEDRADLRPRGEEGSAKIASSDNQVIFNFYLDSIALKIKFPTYKKIDDLLAYLPTISSYLKSQGIEKVELIRITKFNEIKYGFYSDTTPVELAMEGIFSEAMRNWDDFKNPDFSDVARWERRIDFSDSTTHTKAMAMYGFSKDDTDKRKGVLILKTNTEMSGTIGVSDLKESLIFCNDIVDRAFHWCASAGILNEMKRI